MGCSNPEIDRIASLESFLFQYAACYQVSGTCRSATPVVRQLNPFQTEGGRNPPIPHPGSPFCAEPADNAQGGIPYVWVYEKSGDPEDPVSIGGTEERCWIQAVHPGEVQAPARLYYMADSRDYRPRPDRWPPAGINDGWLNGYGNKIFLGTRHYGYANVM